LIVDENEKKKPALEQASLLPMIDDLEACQCGDGDLCEGKVFGWVAGALLPV
jgi:hypothetical protein